MPRKKKNGDHVTKFHAVQGSTMAAVHGTMSPAMKRAVREEDVQVALRAWVADQNPRTRHRLRSALIAAGVRPVECNDRQMRQLRFLRIGGAENMGHGAWDDRRGEKPRS